MMKPLRALAGVALLALGWLGARLPAMRDELLADIAPRPEAPVPRRVAARPAAVMAATQPAAATTIPPMRAAHIVPVAFASAPYRPQLPQRPSPGWHLVALRSDGWIFPARTTPRAPKAARPDDAEMHATDAYAALAAHRRRDAATGFAAALAAAPDDPRAGAWAQERALLLRRWSGSAYMLARDGPADLARAPLLGGGQSGAALAFTPDPLSAMPLALTLHGAVAHRGLGLDTASAQGAAGVRWQPLAGVSLAAERRFGQGAGWSLRIAAGAEGGKGRLVWSGYGEAGLVGTQPFAAAQGFAGARLARAGFEAQFGGGVWGGVQNSGGTASRLDIGPSVRLRHDGWPLTLSVDYRARVGGNAQPGSGIAATLAASF